LSKVAEVADPKRLLEITQDAPSPNVLVQNLLGVARTESAPEGARRRARRSVDGVFTPTRDKAPAKAEVVATNGAVKGVAKSAMAASAPAAVAAPPRPAGAPKSGQPKSAPPKSLPPPERRPVPCGGEPCTGCTPFV
jgi:hypothetical protein